MPITIKEILQIKNELNVLMEAVANDDKGKLFEILHAKHMHPEVKLPTHYRDEEGKSPQEVHDSIKSRISKEEYKTIEGHARDSAANMREHLREQGHNPDHITHVAWTSNGASDVKKFTEKEDPHNDSDVMYRFKHPKTGKVTHSGVGLKYGSQKEPNLRNPGLDSLERMTGATTLLSRFEKHKKKIKSIGYTGTTAENHARWKTEKTSARGKAADESKLETTRAMAKDIHAALAKKSSGELMNYIRGVVSPKTVHPTFRMHTRTSHNEAGATATHHIDEPSKDIEEHLNQFSDLHMEKKHRGGISTVIYGTRKNDGKVVPVLQHAIKGVSGPMKGLAATTKLPGYRSKKKETKKPLKEMVLEAKANKAAAAFERMQLSNMTNVSEEAPANAMGTAGISGAQTAVNAGITGYDLPIGMVRRKPPKMFAGKAVFTVPSSDFYNATLGKRKGKHYRSYVKGELGEEVRQYALENKNAPIILEDETTGAMMYLKYGKEK